MKRSRPLSPPITTEKVMDQSPKPVPTTEPTITSDHHSDGHKNPVGGDHDSILMEDPCWKCKGHGKKRVNHLKGYTGKICPVCQGTGKRQASAKSQTMAQQPGKILTLRGNRGYFAGVRAKGMEHPQVNPGEILGALGCGDWRLFQLANGHKLTVDDFMCAWVAAAEVRKRGYGAQIGQFGQMPPSDPKTFRHADIGCGCGSVLQTMAWAFPQTIRSHGVEAQKVSHDLCRRGLEWNLGQDGTSPDHTVQLYEGDLRTWDGGPLAPYDVVTGTPPYFPIDRFVASENHAQKIRCRVPTRGAASDYVHAAARLVKSNGVVCIAETARQEGERAMLDSIAEANFDILRRVDVITRTGLPPRFSCWLLTPSNMNKCEDDKTNADTSDQETSTLTPPTFPIERFTIRDTDQTRTAEYSQAMDSMGWVDFEKLKREDHEENESQRTSKAKPLKSSSLDL